MYSKEDAGIDADAWYILDCDGDVLPIPTLTEEEADILLSHLNRD